MSRIPSHALSSPQAFIMAFTSDMIPRLVYLYAYHPGSEATMSGYINNSLSVYDISQIPLLSTPEEGAIPAWFNGSFITTCRWEATAMPGHSLAHLNTLCLDFT